jgi:hypothetical protein
VDLRGSFSEDGLAAALYFLRAVGLAARGSISSGSLELVLNWRHYFHEIATHRICAYAIDCPVEFSDWKAEQIARWKHAVLASSTEFEESK